MKTIELSDAQQTSGGHIPAPTPAPAPSPSPYPIIGSLPFPYPLPGYPIPELWEPTVPEEWPSP